MAASARAEPGEQRIAEVRSRPWRSTTAASIARMYGDAYAWTQMELGECQL
ncbi:MAG: hypothetical protein HC772_17260 [Leptolyngbyaceae cyanobacterium CRU_2_3]|nr:hypothetical protein [Leptolyngbyaceae cyanobacterium CRU_2_3]